jgi:hypothetical protein
VIIIESLDAPKSICETEKNPKNPLIWAKNQKKNTKKPKKTKKNTGLVFCIKNPGFFQPWY